MKFRLAVFQFFTMSVSSNWQKIKNKIAQEGTPNKPNKSKRKREEPIPISKSIKYSKSSSKTSKEEVSSINKLWSDNIEQDFDDSLRIEKLDHQAKIGKYISIDCEMVGVGPEGERSVLARVTVVNYHGVVILDKYVRPTEYVTDFRTDVSGITPKSLVNSYDFKDVQLEVANIIKNRIVVGHALHHDFKTLMLDHPRKMRRDTSMYAPFRRIARGKTPSLKRLAKEELGMTIQEGRHSSTHLSELFQLLTIVY
ncbi:ribonuclease H-like domain-containing protein [Gigaspora rosea]|uniref:RNA exonuclease 4 n=1 Tax=Gigaspora rosea TaxID=44941 RepID=A0A397UW48_9GLOM|nr:ribonuclease H-like domain-containing protein [Gigaspora rosea]